MDSMMIQKDFILAPGEEYVQCPYNFAHIVTNAKFIVHLTKCRRDYEKEREKAGKRVKMLACRFNDTHIVIAPEIKFHEERCKDRFNVVETVRYHTSEEFSRKLDDDERRRKEDRKRSKKHKKHKHHDRDRKRRSSSSGKERGSEKHRNGDNPNKDKEKDRGVERVLRIDIYPEQDDANNMNNNGRGPGGVFSNGRGGGRGGGAFNNRGGGGVSNNGWGGGGGGVFKDYGHGHIDNRFRGEKQEVRPPKKPKYDKHVMYNNGEHENMWGDDAEDWEAEAKGNGAAYEPQEAIKEKVILYQPGGLSKAERKQYRADQKLRAARLADSGHDSEDSNDRGDPHPVSNKTDPDFAEATTNFEQVDPGNFFKTCPPPEDDFWKSPPPSDYEPIPSKRNSFNYERTTSARNDFNYEPISSKRNSFNYEPITSKRNDFRYEPTPSARNDFKYEPSPPAKVEFKYEPPILLKVSPPPKIEEDSEKEDGECTDEEFEAFIGEDPFS
ncbi:pre-mRNA-splicing factor cwc25 [Folsomia candida]|uniref:Gametocyte-specific factor 1 n=1 Tax=Folsomia candida TaxID=158441 RepID=A0A226DNP5_FOLCA|nr:pre-mRNA-splicing factor cwc25 [Folsomia candida]OXA46464.1 Gametocyte-specific factor 1 [Folsomia candida]